MSHDDHNISRRRFLKVLAVGAGGAFIVSCSPGTADDPTDDEGGESNGGDETTAIRVAWPGAPSQLDPLNASADVEIAFLNAVYDYLVDTNANSEIVPRLATEWDISDDATTYTLTIAEGVTFHNGDELTLDDIVWNMERWAAEGAGTADLFANVDNIETDAEARTVTVTLSEPNPDFLYNLSDNRTLILQAEAENIGDEFNGTGPFVMEGFSPEDRAVLNANEDYFQGAPAQGLEFLFLGDTEAAINALSSGEVDAVLRIDNTTFQGLQGQGSFRAVSIPTNGHDLVRLRADREPGNDPLVREAFKRATDRQAIFDRIQLGLGALGQDNPIGPLYEQFYVEGIEEYPYSPDEARTLLEEAGYPDGLEMTLYVPNAPGRPELAEVLAAQWAEAGINVEIEVQEESVYYDGRWLEVDLGITPWGSRPYPQFFLDVAYETGARWNEAHWSNEELDSLIQEAGTTVDTNERAAIYEEIQSLITQDGPVVIPYFFASLGVFDENVNGVELHPFPGRTNFYNASLG